MWSEIEKNNNINNNQPPRQHTNDIRAFENSKFEDMKWKIEIQYYFDETPFVLIIINAWQRKSFILIEN